MNFFYNKKQSKNKKFFKFQYQHKKFWKKNWKGRRKFDKDDYRYSWYKRIKKLWTHDVWPHKTYIQNFYSYGHKRELRVKFPIKPFYSRKVSFSYFYQLYNRFFGDITCETRISHKKLKKLMKFFVLQNILQKCLNNCLAKISCNRLENNVINKSIKRLKFRIAQKFVMITKNYMRNFKNLRNKRYLYGIRKNNRLKYKNPYIFSIIKTPQFSFKTQQHSIQKKMRFIHAPCWKNQYNNKNKKFLLYNVYRFLESKHFLKKYFEFLFRFKSIIFFNQFKRLFKEMGFYISKKQWIRFKITQLNEKQKSCTSLIRKKNKLHVKNFEDIHEYFIKHKFCIRKYPEKQKNKKINVSGYFKMRKLKIASKIFKMQFLSKKNYLNNFSFIKPQALQKHLHKHSTLWFFILKNNLYTARKIPFITPYFLWKKLRKSNKLIYSFFSNKYQPFCLKNHVRKIFKWNSKRWLSVLRYAKKWEKIVWIYWFSKHNKFKKIWTKILRIKKQTKLNKKIMSKHKGHIKRKEQKVKPLSLKTIKKLIHYKKKSIYRDMKEIKRKNSEIFNKNKKNSNKKNMIIKLKKSKKKFIQYRAFKKKKDRIFKRLIKKTKKKKKIKKKKRHLFYQKLKTMWQIQFLTKRRRKKKFSSRKFINHKTFKVILKAQRLVRKKYLSNCIMPNLLIAKKYKKIFICKTRQKVIKRIYYRIKFKYMKNLYYKKKFKKQIHKYFKNKNKRNKNFLFLPTLKCFRKFHKSFFGRIFFNKKKFSNIQKHRFFIKSANLLYYRNWNANLIFNDIIYYKNQILSRVSEKLDHMRGLRRKIQKLSNYFRKGKTILNRIMWKIFKAYRRSWHKLWGEKRKKWNAVTTSIISSRKFQRKRQPSFFATLQHLKCIHETCAWTTRLIYTWGIQGYHPRLKKTTVHLGEIEPKYWVQNIMKVIRISTSRRMKYFIKEFKNLSLPTEVVRDYELKEEIIEYIEENWKLYFRNAYDCDSQKKGIWEALNMRWRDLSKKPWFEQLLLPRSFYNKLNYFRMWRKKKTPLQTKKNKIYNLFTAYFYKRYNSAISVSRKQYFRFSQILFKILLPFYGHCYAKRFRKLSKKYQFKKTHNRESLSNITECFERRLDVIVYKLNFAPTIKIASDLVRFGFFTVDGKEQKNPAFIINNYSIVQVKNKLRWALLIKRGLTGQRRIYKKSIPLNMLLNSKLLAGLVLDNSRQANLKKNERVNKYFLKHARLL